MSYTVVTVAAEIRAEMARQRRTGRDLASVLQISQQSASRRMNGETDMSLDEIATVSDWLGLSPTALFERASAQAVGA